jgi:hypothetical protein
MEAKDQDPSAREGLRQVRLTDESHAMSQCRRILHANLGLLGEKAAMIGQQSQRQSPSASRAGRLSACPLQGLLEPSRSDDGLPHTDEGQEIFTDRPG